MALSVSEYVIVEGQNSLTFQEKVREHLSEGWGTHGDTIVSHYIDRWIDEDGHFQSKLSVYYAQALTRYL